MAITVGSVFADREILRPLGSGGMGQVFLTKNLRLGRLEALKVMPIGSSGTLPQRFVSEATTLAALDHPHISTVYQFGVDDDYFWYAMKYLPGDDLEKQMPVSRHDAVTVIRQVAQALDYAHSVGVIHRDVKPSNIHIQRSANRAVSTATVLDFGVAKVVGATALTEVDSFVGTLSYSAPEMISGHDGTAAADQYSFACTVYEMLVGHTPYSARTLTALIAAHAQAPVPSISSYDPSLAACDPVLIRALAKDPRDRFATCGEFADALIRALAPSRVGRATNERHFPPERPPSLRTTVAPPAGRASAPPHRLADQVFVRRRRIAGLALGVVAALLVTVVFLLLRPSPPTTPTEAHADPSSSIAPETTPDPIASGPAAPDARLPGTSSGRVGAVWGLAVAPTGQTYRFSDYLDPESLIAAATKKWGYQAQTWSLVYFESGCASFARPNAAARGTFAYQSGMGPDSAAAEATAAAKVLRHSDSSSTIVDTLCVGGYDR
ncbi:serine/threonine-protein kinase [Gordonia hydrophobica]|uniref:non-specific serine/threonine protein kinase n=1 Tax=Gordonia hydrophobica TaxID=40516 RepID=A0ABZ2U456_9ACTN|nr:serine/threonine-protein kinase [Gordonia hydrophobica]MBM7367956.1 serine/threonine-protein kinase [Gordonia hydrophobica]